MGDHRHRAAQRVARLAGALDPAQHLGLQGGIDGAQRRAVVHPQQVVPGGRRRVGADRAEGAHAAAQLDAGELGEQHLGEGAGGDARRGLAGGGAFEHVAQVAAQVLEAAGEIGVAGARGLEAAQLGGAGVDCRGVRRHHLLPVGVVAVGDPQHQRRAQGDAAAHAAADLGGIALDLHAPAAADAVLAARQVAGEQREVDDQPGRQAEQGGRQPGAVALPAGGQA